MSGLQVGEVVPGTGGRRWLVGPQRGQGTCCTVYEATLHGEHKTKAALKVYKEGENFAGAHDREALMLELVHKKEKCKHIVSVIDDFDYKNLPCLVQELLDCDIRQTIFKNCDKGLSLHVIQKLAWQMIVGVSCLHSYDFVHGDLKPTNLMWDPELGVLKVIDFSLSFHLQDQNVSLLQSQGYRAPETELWNRSICPQESNEDLSVSSSSELAKAKDKDHITRPDKTSDLWSIGCVLVEMFTGEKMFTRQKLQEIMDMQAKVLTGGVNGLMTLWLSQLLRARAHDDTQPNSRQLLAKFTELVGTLLQFSSEDRGSCQLCLAHPFFTIQTAASITDLVILPTRVLRFLNMLEVSDLEDADTLQDVKEDIREECEKFGAVTQVQLPTVGRGRCKVYVEFSDALSSMAAFTRLCKKTFNHRTVIVSFYPVEFMMDKRLE